jgi:hypothetical protein
MNFQDLTVRRIIKEFGLVTHDEFLEGRSEETVGSNRG